MIRKIKKKVAAVLKRSKPAAKGKKKVPGKTARAVAKGASPHAERAKGRGTTPSIESGTRRAAAQKRKRAARSSTEPEPELRRLNSARRKLERQLTAAVQEIGLLRQYELKARFLEAEVEKRDGQLGDLRRQYETRIRELESRLGDAVPEAAQGRLI